MAELDPKAVWPGWETVRILGRGSFGAVYEIRRDMLGETEKAALKVITIPQSDSDIDQLYDEGYDDESITSTFREFLKNIVAEYSLMRKLNGCSNVVSCDDARYVQHEDGIGWDIFIKMELLTPLGKHLGKEVPDEQVRRIGADLCNALILCKKFNIVHRDIKPANIFVSDLGDYKLGDFGIAKTMEKTSGATKTGTYEYMAPEVYRDLPYGSTVDIYSLGMVLYWLLNERRTPFLSLPPKMPTSAEKEQARKRRFDGEAIPAPAHGSKELQRIVLKAVAYDPRDRYQSAEEMLRDLESPEAGMRNTALHEDVPAPAAKAESPAKRSLDSHSLPRDDRSRKAGALGGPKIAAGENAAVSPAEATPGRPPVSTGDLRPNEAPAAARGSRPPQAVPLSPVGGRQASSGMRASVDEDATVSVVHAAAPAAIDEDATVSAVRAAPPVKAAPPANKPVTPKTPRPEESARPIRQPAPPAEKQPAPPAKPGKKKLLPILIGAGALVAALVLVLVLVILPKSGKQPAPSSFSSSASAGRSDTTSSSAAAGREETEHDWGEWITDREATCNSLGEQHRVCKNDSSHTETRSIDYTEHQWIPATASRPETCAVCGAYKGVDFEGHWDHGSIQLVPLSEKTLFISLTDDRTAGAVENLGTRWEIQLEFGEPLNPNPANGMVTIYPYDMSLSSLAERHLRELNGKDWFGPSWNPDEHPNLSFGKNTLINNGSNREHTGISAEPFDQIEHSGVRYEMVVTLPDGFGESAYEVSRAAILMTDSPDQPLWGSDSYVYEFER